MEDAMERKVPKVAFLGLASCFGCQINITNIEQHLMDVVGQIDLAYWQLTTSGEMPEEFDVAVIEGAVTTREAEEAVRHARDVADCVITIGSCAKTAGIPGMASVAYEPRQQETYGAKVPAIVSDVAVSPKAVSDVIDVDFEVPCCPIDPYEFVRVLQHVLVGSNAYRRTSTLCGECKRNEHGCFFGRGVLCLGLVTTSGCGAKCPDLDRPCNGCAGLSEDANLEAARACAKSSGIQDGRLDEALEMFNAAKASA